MISCRLQHELTMTICSRPSSLLEQADIIYRVGISPSVRFAFKHVLLRDAIYNSLLKSKTAADPRRHRGNLGARLSEAGRKPARSPRLSLSRSGQSPNGHSLLVRSPGNARSRIPPTLKRLQTFERPCSFSTLCRKRLSGPNKRSTFSWRWESRLSLSRVYRRGNPRSVFAGSHLVPAARQHPGVFPGLVWLVGKSLDGRKER